MITDELQSKKERYQAALDALQGKLREDRYVLAAVLLGSLTEITIWRRDAISLWIVEADGVTRRRASDGEDERIFRTLAEDDVNFHAELIPRSRFKRMIEGTSRTAFTHSFFAQRKLLFSQDPSIERWFDDANRLAVRDQQKELFIVATWITYGVRHARRLLEIRGDERLAWQELLGVAWCLAALEIIRHGEVYEDEIVARAAELRPDLFQIVYENLLTEPRTREKIDAALLRAENELEERGEKLFRPVLKLLRKEGAALPFSHIADHFAYTQLYPWHLESACEWLAENGIVEKLAAPMRLTSKSRVELEEPAYFYEGM